MTAVLAGSLLVVTPSVAAAADDPGAQARGAQWISTVTTPGASNISQDVAVDPFLGSAFVTGTSTVAGQPADLLTAGYDSEGRQLWTARLPGAGAAGAHLALDTERKLVNVVGAHVTADGTRDIVVASYDYTGTLIEDTVIDRNGRDDTPSDAGVNLGNGTVFVTGSTAGTRSSDRDFLTLAVDDGDVQWLAQTSGPGRGRDTALALIPATDFGVIVTGEAEIGGGIDSYTVSYSPTGAVQWTRRIGVPGATRDSTSLIGDSPDGSIIYLAGSSGSDGLAAAVLASTGRVGWQQTSGQAGLDGYTALASDPTGGVFVGGSVATGGTTSEVFTAAYEFNGTPRWTSRLAGGPSYDTLRGLNYDAQQQRLFATVDRTTNPVRFTSAINVYSLDGTTGAQRGLASYTNGPDATATPLAAALNVNSNSQLIVTGYGQRQGSNAFYLTVAFNTL